MADGSRIEWTDSTWNIVTGCSVVSAGCKRCYAMKLAGTRLKHDPSREGLTIDAGTGPVWNGQVRFNTQWLEQPLRWKRSRKIFVCAHGDLFHDSVPDAWIDQVFAVMALAPHHTFQILTKRAKRMRRYLDGVTRHTVAKAALPFTGRKHPDGHDCDPVVCNIAWPLTNVWLGVSVENQAAADERIHHLLQTPAAVRWLSCEPLLGSIDLTSVAWPDNISMSPHGHRVDVLRGGYWAERGGGLVGPSATLGAPHGYFCNHSDMATIDWVVVGGESGPGSRPMHPEWVRSLRDQCIDDCFAKPFFFKQWGDWAPGDQAVCSMDECYECSKGGWVEIDGTYSAGETAKPEKLQAAHIFRLGKRRAGRMLDGLLHDAFPIRNGSPCQRPVRDIAEDVVSKWCLMGSNHAAAVDDVALALAHERSAKAGTA